MRAVRITRFGGPEVFDVVDLPDPAPEDGEQLFDISSSGVDLADTHHGQMVQQTNAGELRPAEQTFDGWPALAPGAGRRRRIGSRRRTDTARPEAPVADSHRTEDRGHVVAPRP